MNSSFNVLITERTLKRLLVLLIISATVLSCTKNEEPKAVQQQHGIIKQSDETTTSSTQIAVVRENLKKAKTRLAEEDTYDCCIEDACDYYALNEASCSCAPELKNAGHVCLDCYAGWQQEKGEIPKITKANVTTDFVTMTMSTDL